jgi:hypothetical protein
LPGHLAGQSNPAGLWRSLLKFTISIPTRSRILRGPSFNPCVQPITSGPLRVVTAFFARPGMTGRPNSRTRDASVVRTSVRRNRKSADGAG